MEMLMVMRPVMVVVMFTFTAGLLTQTQAVTSPEVLLKAAIEREQVDGDRLGAIALYENLIAKYPDSYAVAARALRQLAGCYEKIGRADDARATYERIVRDYGGQTEAVRIARAWLDERARKAPTDTPMERRILADDAFEVSDVSRDGRVAVGMDRAGEIQLRRLQTGETIRLVPVSPTQTSHWPVLSVDGRFVAYGTIARPSGTGPRPVSLCVVAAETGAVPKTVISQPSGPTYLPAGWSPDGKEILVSRGLGANNGIPGQLVAGTAAWASVADGSLRVIKTFDVDRNPGRLAQSYDGRWFAYSLPVSASSGATQSGPGGSHIYVMDASGQSETVVVNMLGVNSEPKWTLDGRHLLFVGDRSGTALWSVAVENGHPVGEPSLVRAGLQRGLIGVSNSGTLLYTRTAGNEFTTFVVDAAHGPNEVTHVFSGGSPVLSPDGRSVAFLRYLGPRDGAKARPFELTVRSLDTGRERGYPHEGVDRLAPIQWRVDGSGLIVAINAKGDGGRPGGSFYGVDVRRGVYTPIVARHSATHQRSNAPALSRDGKTFYVAVRRDSGAVSQIVAIDSATGLERPVITFPIMGLPAMQIAAFDGDYELAPALTLSPDGATLALLTIETPERRHLFAVKVDGTEYREVFGPFASTLTGVPSWTADGQSIVIGETNSTGMRAMRVPLNGDAPTPFDLDLTRLAGRVPVPRVNPSTGSELSLSRDGTRLAFEATTVRSFELWALENVISIVSPRR